MKYYLLPLEEENLGILSEIWCIGTKYLNIFYTGYGWKLFIELIDKSNTENNLLEYYTILDEKGIPIDYIDFFMLLNKLEIMER